MTLSPHSGAERESAGVWLVGESLRTRPRRRRQLQQAVLAAFSTEDATAIEESITDFGPADWQRCYGWLDASGLALYFLNRLATLKIDNTIPPSVLARLNQNLTDNKKRTAVFLEELATLHRVFQRSGLHYAALKGATLVPDYCPELSLRQQIDIDFLMARSDRAACRAIMCKLGYRLAGTNEETDEFRAGESRNPSIEDLYKPSLQRAAEVHFACGKSGCHGSDIDAVLSRVRPKILAGEIVPALAATDLFVAQIQHLHGHMLSEWTRVSWLFEYCHFIKHDFNDTEFWRNLHEASSQWPERAITVGSVTTLAARIFGCSAPRDLTKWSIDALPEPIRLWIERYGPELALAQFPGTKLYLLLLRETMNDEVAWRRIRRTRLFPFRRPPQVITLNSNNNRSKRERSTARWRYAGFRLRFHIVELVRYAIEARRWRKVFQPNGWSNSSAIRVTISRALKLRS